MVTSAERVSWILRITSDLEGRSWTDERMVLNQFGIPDHSGSGDRDDFRSRRLQSAPDDALESLWRFVTGTAPATQEPTLAPSSQADLVRLWGTGSPRIFLSHKAEYKVAAKQLKEDLSRWGASSFVAHEDIKPTRKWQMEIERALFSMDVLVALLSKGFSKSYWANQEIGIAIGRRVPVLAVRIHEDPRGFKGSVQAVPGAEKPEETAKNLVRAMSGYPALVEPLLIGVVRQWEAVRNFDEAKRAMGLLDACNALSHELLVRIESAHNMNDQLHKSTVVRKSYPSFIRRIKAALSEG
jgi:hypothetical protein